MYLQPAASSNIDLSRIEPGSPEEAQAIQKVGRQLEAVFVRLMFEEMAKGTGENALFPESPGSGMYQEWYRGQISENFSEGGGFGLAETFTSQILGRRGAAAAPVAPRVAAERASARWRRSPGAEPRVTSGFGHRTHPVTGKYSMHRGVDLSAADGTPIRTPMKGQVLRVGEDERLGIHVVVEHEDGYRTLYGHLSSASVAQGDEVSAASEIGRSGSTGRVTGPHLHFGLYHHGEALDPASRVRFSDVVDASSHDSRRNSGARSKK